MMDENFQYAKIKVIGVGGGGGNAVSKMSVDKNSQIEYWVFNTESQALIHSPCQNRFVLGKNVTKGLGAGGDPKMGEQAALDSYEEIKDIVRGTNLVFLACGEGGGTGTGATPIIAKAAKEVGCLVLAIVTRPFSHEGKIRNNNANNGIVELRKNVDALVIVSNDKLIFTKGSMALTEAFNQADLVLAEAVKTITDIILINGLMNLDFADVSRTLKNKGLALIGVGEASGPNKAIIAAQNAITSPLLERSIKGARKLLINVTIGPGTTIEEFTDAINTVKENCTTSSHEDDTIEGVQVNKNYVDKIKVAVIASEFDDDINLINKTINQNNDVEEDEDDSSIPVHLHDFLAQEKAKRIIPVKEEEEETVIKEHKEEEIKIEESGETSLLTDFFNNNNFEDDIVLNERIEPTISEDDDEDDSTIVTKENNTGEININSINDIDDEDDYVVLEKPTK